MPRIETCQVVVSVVVLSKVYLIFHQPPRMPAGSPGGRGAVYVLGSGMVRVTHELLYWPDPLIVVLSEVTLVPLFDPEARRIPPCS